MLRRFVRRLLMGRNVNPTRVVVVSFGAIILVGTLLLALPVASKSGESAGFLTALFTATSATCVTGLVVVDTWMQWSLFGQSVILVMIQFGGLGFITIISLFSIVLHRRIGLSERLIIMSTFNLNDMSGLAGLVRHVLAGTAIMEGVGAVILSICFIPDFGWRGGIWRGLFHSVSAFCNAGFDLMGSGGAFTGLTTYADRPAVLLTVMLLIIVGGLGFFVWEDLWKKRCWRKLDLYSKLVIAVTAFLLLSGTLCFLVGEWNNGGTLGAMPIWEKTLNAAFQSVTLRTAGFNTLDQSVLSENGQVLSILFMLIGGGSGSTAGGLKVMTVTVLALAIRASMTGREEVYIRGRSIPHYRVMNALTLTVMVGALFIAASMVIATVDGIPFLAAAFETASAMGTVGLSMGVTPTLTAFSRLLVICLMFIGRVGILSFSIAFLIRSQTTDKLHYPTFTVMIG